MTRTRTALAMALTAPLLAATASTAHATPPPAPSVRAASHVDHRAGEHTIRVITYNLGNGTLKGKRSDLARLTRHKPAVITLQEAAGSATISMLKGFARRTGWRLRQPEVGAGSRHNAILVRPDVRVLDSRTRLLTKAAEVTPGTKGAKPARPGDPWISAPKYVNWVLVKVDGIRWRVGTVHLVPSAEHKGFAKTKRLHRRQVGRSTAWYTTSARNVETVLTGDFNATLGHPADLLEALRKKARGNTRESHGHRAIDIVWSRRNQGRQPARALGLAKRDEKDFSSDHRPIRVDVSVTR